jgi:ArsR family transcriptional regulator, nickel/cobalt-responsive transcriptional repressor
MPDRVGVARSRASGERLSDQTLEQVADTMFALATPSRLRILHSLRAGPRTVSEIVDSVGMEQSAVSHQLRVLREHSVLGMRRVGRTRQYALRDEHVGALLDEALFHVRALERPGAKQLDPFSDARSAAS